MSNKDFNPKAMGLVVPSRGGTSPGDGAAFVPVASDKTGIEAINECLRLAKLDCRVKSAK
jgi:hypothetical protein